MKEYLKSTVDVLNEQKTKLTTAQEQLQQAKAGTAAIREQLAKYKPLLAYMSPEQQEMLLSSLEQALESLTDNLIQKDDSQAEESELSTERRVAEMEMMLAEVSNEIKVQEALLAEGLVQIDTAQKEIDVKRQEIETGELQLKEGKETLEETQLQIDKAQKEVSDGKSKIQTGWAATEDAKEELAEAEEELAQGEAELLDGEKELADGWKEYYDGLEEYEEGYAEFAAEIADAEAFHAYLAGLTVYQLTGNYSFSDSERCFTYVMDTQGGTMVVMLYDNVVKTVWLHRDAQAEYYYVPEGIDWDYIETVIIPHPAMNVYLKVSDSTYPEDLRALLQRLWRKEDGEKVLVYENIYPEGEYHGRFGDSSVLIEATFDFSYELAAPFTVLIESWDYSSGYTVSQADLKDGITMELPDYSAHYTVNASFYDKNENLYEAEFWFNIGDIYSN